jgi:histidinol-phosphate aminotransferase
MSIQELLRENIRHLKPYSSARDEFTGDAALFLDANENGADWVANLGFNRYPDPHQKAVKKAIADFRGVNPNQIFLGNGSDEAIDLLIRAFCEPGKESILIPEPTYGMYAVAAAVNNVETLSIPLKPDFQLDLPAMVAAFSPRVKILFLCSPNNPSGNFLHREDIRDLLHRFTGLIVLDEAYVDFSPEASLLPLLAQYPRLVILQTFSKAWGLAGLRAGMAFANPEIIAILEKIKYPYNVNSHTQKLLLQALQQKNRFETIRNQIIAERDKLKSELQKLTIVKQVHPSNANFLLVKFSDAASIFQKLLECGIVVRDRSKQTHCENCLRLTIGTADENKLLIQTLKKIESI